MDKVFQALIACDSLYGLGALVLICITIIVGLCIAKTVIFKITETYNYFHAKFNGKSIQSEIDLQSKAA